MAGCRFCEISANNGDHVIYESEEYLAFLDNRPLSKGHFLVIPKEHYEHVRDIPKEEFMALNGKVYELAESFCKVLKADGYNLALNNGKVAEQHVNHLHVHVIPRYEGDKTRIRADNGEMDRDIAELEMIQKLLSQHEGY